MKRLPLPERRPRPRPAPDPPGSGSGLPPFAVPLAAVLAAAALLPTPLVAQGAPDFDEVRAFIRDTMTARDLPSVAVAAARDGEIVWEEAFGWANRAERVEATPHTPYSLASISKPMTATGLMALAEAGKVRLDAPVNRYLGRSGLTGLAGEADSATVERVLAHTAGLPLHYQFFYEDESAAPPPMPEAIRRYGVLVFPPGERFAYSNLGYGVLDHVISRVAGRQYADYMRAEVFVPLGMTRTAVGLPPELEPHAAVRYDPDTQEPVPFYRFDHTGASAVWSSAHDLLRFGLFHLGHLSPGARAVLSSETRRRMRERRTPGSGGEGYGLGWLVQDEYGFRKVWHTGSMPGVSTMLALYPEEDAAVVVLMNTVALDLRVEIQRRIAGALIPGYAEAQEKAREAARRERERRRREAEADTAVGRGPEARTAPRVEERMEGTWKGTVRTWKEDLPFRLVFRTDGDVHARLGDQPESLLNDVSLEEGVLRGRMAGHVPTPDADRAPRQELWLELLVEEGTMRGQLTSGSAAAPVRFALSSYAELRKAE